MRMSLRKQLPGKSGDIHVTVRGRNGPTSSTLADDDDDDAKCLHMADHSEKAVDVET